MGTGLMILSSQIAICTLRASGRKYYDFLHENFKGGMPSSLTVNRCIEELYPVVREAEKNFENFIICYLEKNNLEIIVCLSEEETSIVINVE